jgi:CRISPR-associated endonuclease/helicase Cas3
MLSAQDFAGFFREVHGYAPFPWQERLLRQVSEQGEWPDLLDLPTGSGKTSSIDVAVFHLALEAHWGAKRRAPLRIALVVDRRLYVDDAYLHAQKLAHALANPLGPITQAVADALRLLSGDGPPLIAQRLRGGMPREDGWARTPSQPTILCSTVDQVGSRLLFRGYGVSDSMKPVHAGLIGSDCLILLDEAHISDPFRQTLEWAKLYRGDSWRQSKDVSPWGFALLTATPRQASSTAFALSDEDRSDPTLSRRMAAPKPARLIQVSAPKGSKDDPKDDTPVRASKMADEVQSAIAHFRSKKHPVKHPAIGVIVNRIGRARAAFEAIRSMVDPGDADVLLLIGPARPVDREQVMAQLRPLRTGADRTLERTLIIVSTQCIEAGVDIDLDGLITEITPIDSLRQRFGRLNRDGRDITPYAAIVSLSSDVSASAIDPIYGKALGPCWALLRESSEKIGGRLIVDFGLTAFGDVKDASALSASADAPILLPAHLDLLSQTSPIPACDPDISLYLHGEMRDMDSVSVIWRADVSPDACGDDAMYQLLGLVPPRALEAVELPAWAVRAWLLQSRKTGGQPIEIADVASAPADLRHGHDTSNRPVYRWTGSSDDSAWIDPQHIRPGDTIIVPAVYGGLDQYGWNPSHIGSVADVASQAAAPFAGGRFAVRVAPGLLGDPDLDRRLAAAIARAGSRRWRDLREAIMTLDLPEDIEQDLKALDEAHDRRTITAHIDVYMTEDDRPSGVIFVAPLGLKGRCIDGHGRPNATEHDSLGSGPGYTLTLAQHSLDVAEKAERFASISGLSSDRIADLGIAGSLHDFGKVDPRYQTLMHWGDPLAPGADEGGPVLAKSTCDFTRSAIAAADLPPRWRHEALSVRLAMHSAKLAEAADPELALWLVGTHHGYGRPFFPHADPADSAARHLPEVPGIPSELPAGDGPQSLAFDLDGSDWSNLFARLKARYGLWELARMEAILRLADHRASEDRAQELKS